LALVVAFGVPARCPSYPKTHKKTQHKRTYPTNSVTHIEISRHWVSYYQRDNYVSHHYQPYKPQSYLGIANDIVSHVGVSDIFLSNHSEPYLKIAHIEISCHFKPDDLWNYTVSHNEESHHH
jgi:hypothetical protein